MRPFDSIERMIQRDQAFEVLRGLALTMVGSIFVSCSLAVMMWNAIPRDEIVAVVIVNALINAFRFGLATFWIRGGYASREPGMVLTLSWLGALLSGFCWAGALIGCAAYGRSYDIAVGLAFCGVNAGAIIQNKASWRPACAFILPNVTILVWLFLAEGAFTSGIVAVNMTLLTGLMVRCSVAQERFYLSSSRLKYEAIELADSLRSANIAAGNALERLEYAATHDHLTGLSNRAAFQAAFEARLDQEMPAEAFWVLLIDLDRFKAINDTFGHAVGDEVLVSVGRHLRTILGPDAIVARFGGDEFGALVAARPGDRDGCSLAQALVEHLQEIVLASGQTIAAGASVGIAHYPGDGGTVPELQVNADLALYAAKTAGRGAWRRFEPALRGRATDRHTIEHDLPAALAAGAVRAWFQPQIDGRTGCVVGLEALLRWKHPQLGWVSPPDVVAAAASIRLSRELTRTILRDACRMAKTLGATGHAGIVVSINISPAELGTYPIAEMVAAELAAHDLPATRLAIEITEEAVYSSERGGGEIEALQRMGVCVMVDDFGTACASVGSLRNLRFETIKIDRSFIRGIAQDPRDRRLVEAILAFARTLGVLVIAEGIETREQVEILRRLGCPVLQGYYFAPPIPGSDIPAWVARTDTQASAANEGVAPGRPRSAVA